jgi:DNA-binding CsgD family transcriptional regulator
MPDYGASEIGIARSFVHHARNAVDIQQRLARSRTIHAVLSDLANAAGQPFAVVDGSNVIHASASFRALFASPSMRAGERVAFSQRDLPDTPLHLPREVVEAIARHDGLGPATAVTKQASGKRLIAQIKPFSFPDSLHGQTRLVLAVIIHDPNQRSSIDEKLLQSAYELTKSEAHICSLLVDGHSVDRISADADISPNTVRSHLQRIFQKTGVTRQLDLVKLVLNVASSSHAHRPSSASTHAPKQQADLARPRVPSAGE